MRNGDKMDRNEHLLDKMGLAIQNLNLGVDLNIHTLFIDEMCPICYIIGVKMREMHGNLEKMEVNREIFNEICHHFV